MGLFEEWEVFDFNFSYEQPVGISAGSHPFFDFFQAVLIYLVF